MKKNEAMATLLVGALTAGALIWLTQTVDYSEDYCFQLCKSELRRANTLVDIQRPSFETIKKLDDCYSRCEARGE